MRGSRGSTSTCDGGPVLHDHAAVEEQHLVGHLPGEAHLVGHHDHRPALGGQRLHHLQHLADQLGVQGAGRLVEQHDPRPGGQRPGDADALLLPAGQLHRVGVRLVGQAHAGQQRQRLRRAPRARGRPCASTGPAVTLSSTVRWGNRLCAWKTMPLCAAQPGHRAGVRPGRPVELDVADPHGAGLRRLQPVEAAQHRRLAGAGRPDEAGDRPRRHLHVDAAQHAVGAERLLQAAGLEQRRALMRPRTGTGGSPAGPG